MPTNNLPKYALSQMNRVRKRLLLWILPLFALGICDLLLLIWLSFKMLPGLPIRICVGWLFATSVLCVLVATIIRLIKVIRYLDTSIKG